MWTVRFWWRWQCLIMLWFCWCFEYVAVGNAPNVCVCSMMSRWRSRLVFCTCLMCTCWSPLLPLLPLLPVGKLCVACPRVLLACVYLWSTQVPHSPPGPPGPHGPKSTPKDPKWLNYDDARGSWCGHVNLGASELFLWEQVSLLPAGAAGTSSAPADDDSWWWRRQFCFPPRPKKAVSMLTVYTLKHVFLQCVFCYEYLSIALFFDTWGQRITLILARAFGLRQQRWLKVADKD